MKAFLIAILIQLILCTVIVRAQVNPLDLSFNDSGIVIQKLDKYSRANKVAVQPDGKVIVAAQKGDTADWVILRYSNDGSLDPSFGDNGMITEAVNGGAPTGVYILDSGKIIVIGNTNSFGGKVRSDYAIIRYLQNGALDSSFGNNGRIIGRVDSTRNNFPIALLVTDQRLIVIGRTIGDFYPDTGIRGFILRYHSDGAPDSIFFGNQGSVTFPFENKGGYVIDAVLTPDQRILALCSEDDGHNDNRITLRYLSWDGSLERLTTPPIIAHIEQPFHPNYGTGICKTRDSALIIAGTVLYPAPPNRLCVTKYSIEAVRDSSFQFKPILIGEVGNFIYDVSIIERPDKSVFITGLSSVKGIGTFLVKCKPNGNLDSSFAANGIFFSKLPTKDWFESEPSIAVDSSNRILLASGIFPGNKSLSSTFVKRFIDKPAGTVDTKYMDKIQLTVYPHPFSNKFTLLYDLPTPSQVSCEMYSLEGRLLATLFSFYQSLGPHTEELILNESISPGSYILRLNTPNGSQDLQVIKQ